MAADGKVLYEEQEIRGVLGQAMRASALLEIILAGEEQRYVARLISGGDGQPFVEDGVLTTPLEPTAGNIKIRRAMGVQVGFYLGDLFYETKSGFVRVQALENGQAMVLSMPRVLRGVARRQQNRTHVPPEIDISVLLEQRGEVVLQGKLNDISPAGLSFSCEAASVPIEKGERIKLTLSGRELGGNANAITMPATIAFHARVRKSDDIQCVVDKYGVQFGTVNAVQSMQIDRIIKFLDKRSLKS